MIVILASRSPRRRRLLSRILAGRRFRVFPSDVPECRRPNETARAFVRRMAAAKAVSAWRRHHDRIKGHAVIIGADTVICDRGLVIGRPRSARHARRILGRLSGRRHDVVTGICLYRTSDGHIFVASVTSRVWMKKLSAATIRGYVASGEPLDKAGAYGIQGEGRRLISKYRGSYSNIVGLPSTAVRALLRAAR